MRRINKNILAIAGAVFTSVVLLSSTVTAQDAPKREFFQATAMGQGTQLGRVHSINLTIEEYSTAEDQQALLEAFNTKGMEGLSNALGKMKSKGRLSITGTLGYEVTYIRSFPTATGRKIRIATNRAIRFGEAWGDSRSRDYDLSALELEIHDDKDKNTGILLPACKFKLDKEKHLTIEAYQNPWKLQNVQDR